jgi:hypothetical protein
LNYFEADKRRMSSAATENNVRQDAQKMRVADLMLAFEAELLDLGHLAERAQTTLSNVLAKAAHDPECHRDAQVLDLLTQRLYGMSGFLTILNPSIPPVWELDADAAASSVSLGDLADRLSGVAVIEVEPQGFGELEMF